jgi:hypothetical protein
MTVPGDPLRLGATWDGTTTNFAVFSSVAAYGGSVMLSLYHRHSAVPTRDWPS